MKMEFIPDASEDCPLIRLYDFKPQEARDLQKALERLAEEKDQAIALHEQPWIQAINCGLTLKAGKRNIGIRLTPKLSELECTLRAAYWKGAAGLAEPFGLDEPGTGDYQ